MGPNDRGYASPYSTGGGGTTLEHAYGAMLLAALLLRHPVVGLGDEFTVREVRFQQGATCPVDDLVVLGDCPPISRTMYVGVRRAPTIGGGNASFVTLLVDYLRMVIDRHAGLDTDRERLGLAVAAPHTGAVEVAQLASLARRQPDDLAFRRAVAAPRATNAKIRTRLQALDDAVTTAAAQRGIPLPDTAARDALTWRLLKALRIIELRLEGDDQADRTGVVSRLVSLAGDPARAVAVWRRLRELSAEYAQTAATVTYEMVVRDVATVVPIAPLTPASAPLAVRDEQMYERLRQLPALNGPRLLAAWRDDQTLAWRLITAVTTVEDRPAEVLRQWQASRPAWLGVASWQVQLAAGELAASYGAGILAADLFTAAATQGAPRRASWLARAALIYDENGSDDGRQAALTCLPASLADSEPFAGAVVALLGGDRDTAVRIVEAWAPEEPSDRTLRAALRLRLAAPADAHPVLDRHTIDRGLYVLAEALRDQWAAGLAVARAQLLITRAHRGESPNWDADLREARSLAVRARDDRRTYRGDSAEAVAVACHASMLLMDLRRVLELGAPDGEANAYEAASADVCQCVAIAAIQFGQLDLARQRAEHVPNGPGRARIDAYLAQADGQDPQPHWWRAAELAGDSDEQLAQALLGLAQIGVDGLTRYPAFAHRHPDEAVELRAMTELAAGRPGSAIVQLRDRRRSSVTAALNLAQAYQAAGQIDDQVQTLRDAADHFGDRSLRHSAAEVLARAGRTAEAEQELDALLAAAEPNWSGRADALRLAAQLANDSGRFDRVCHLLRTVLQIEPEDTTSRWALIRTQMNRGDVTEAWRALHEAPQPLDPSNTADARAWIHLHRRRGQPVETVTGCLRLLRRFGDDEQFVAFALMNLMLPWPETVELPDGLRAQLAAESEQFFQRWPDSRHLRRLQAADLDQLRTAMIAMMRHTSDQQLLWRRLAHGLARGHLPLAVLAAAAGRSYAEICLRRGDGVLPAHVPDRSEFTACVKAAQAAEDHDIVIDTPAATVLLTLPDDVRRAAMSRFARVLTTDDVMLDSLAAEDTLALRTTGSMRYEDQHDRLLLDETSEAEADRLAQDAAGLHAAIEALARRTTPLTGRTFDEPLPGPLSVWASPLDLARAEDAVLWSDDPVLRVLARGTGVRAASTQAVLHQLVTTGAITEDQHEDCIRRLIKARIGHMPLNERRLLELAEDDNWHPAGVAAALARPTTWADASRTLAFYQRLTRQVRTHAPGTLHDWLYAAVRGANTFFGRPVPAAGIAACLLATTIEIAAAQGEQVAHLVAATRQALTDTDDPDGIPAADPLPIAVTLLRDAYAKGSSRKLATRFVIETFTALGEIDKDAIIRVLLE
ncbi:PIN domain-containing protein [Micromonospora marina]|uniref:tetratricopeptide repeat protein n=1 Tax=Micromonospora marina TaxID=307120 RepID=UPI003D720B1C